MIAADLRTAVEDITEEARQRANDHAPELTIDRAEAMATWVEGLLDVVDPLIVPPSALTPMESPLQQAAVHVRNTTANPAEVANASAYLDQVFTNAIPLVAATPAVREIAEKVARGFGISLGLRTKALQSQADDLATTLTTTRAQLNELRDEATRADEQRKIDLQTRIEQLSASVDQMQARIDQFLASSEEAAEAGERRRARAFETAEEERVAASEQTAKDIAKELDEALQQVNATTAETTEKLAADAKAVIDKLTTDSDDTLGHVLDVREKVDKLYGIISKEGTAGAFHDEAKDERDAANTWRKIAVGFAVAAIIVAVAGAVYDLFDDHTTWQQTVAKIAVTAALGAVAAYAGKQSGHHRRREEQAKQLELDLTAIGPFIEDMPEDDEARNKIRQQFVDRWMAGRAAVPETDASSVPLNVPVEHILGALLGRNSGSK